LLVRRTCWRSRSCWWISSGKWWISLVKGSYRLNHVFLWWMTRGQN
jgi:hypothetical protein